MGSFIADPDGRNAFMQMATQAVKKAIDTADANQLPQAYDADHCHLIKKDTDSPQTSVLKKNSNH